ncbi:MAG: hypothetical protein JWO71_4460 [Candidatus Acidoferrum typicum]|nr:hypothetical protein [Candidatus Acidoferrum typicum]
MPQRLEWRYVERLGRDDRRRVEIREVAAICNNAVDENGLRRRFRTREKFKGERQPSPS